MKKRYKEMKWWKKDRELIRGFFSKKAEKNRGEKARKRRIRQPRQRGSM